MKLYDKAQKTLTELREKLLKFLIEQLNEQQEFTFSAPCNLHSFDQEMLSIHRDGEGDDAKYFLNTIDNSTGRNEYHSLLEDDGTITLEDLHYIVGQIEV